MATPLCKDCRAEGVTTTRVLATKRDGSLEPGPRCVTHHRARKRAVSTANHAKRVEQTYGITGEQYQALHAAQDGRCAICRKASGKARRLAVDHDHETGEVRGLLCKTCNYIVLGRYTAEALQRAIDYLDNPPARKILNPLEAAA